MQIALQGSIEITTTCRSFFRTPLIQRLKYIGMEVENNEVRKGSALKNTATKAVGMVRTMPRAFVATPPAPYEGMDDRIHNQLVRELHTYRRKNKKIARVIWLLGGLLGLHRFYLGQIGYGILMLCTIGGGLVLWIIDGFKLNELINAYNAEQEEREAEDRPPIGMDHVPVSTPESLLDYPAWGQQRLFPKGVAQKRSRRFFELTADFFAIMFFGFVLGAITQSTEYNSAAWAVLAILFMINFIDYLIPYHDWPIARGLIHWDYRLRLFYHFNEPGRRWKLYFRPLLGLLYAPFNKKARTEVLLYLELGSVFVVGRLLLGLLGGDAWTMLTTLDLEGFFSNWIESIVLGFITIYGFAGPIGAIMMKHVLLRRKNYVRWGLSLITVFFLISGYLNG